MAKKELIKKWMEKAEEDFGFASASLKEEINYFPQICWHFQQAAEKYFKAYIIAFDLDFKKIHDLIALLGIRSQKEPCKYLQKFYIETRYPVVWESKHTKTDTLRAQEATQNIITFIKTKIGLKS